MVAESEVACEEQWVESLQVAISLPVCPQIRPESTLRSAFWNSLKKLIHSLFRRALYQPQVTQSFLFLSHRSLISLISNLGTVIPLRSL